MAVNNNSDFRDLTSDDPRYRSHQQETESEKAVENQSEEEIDYEIIEKFIAELLADKNNFKSGNTRVAKLLENLPQRLKAHLEELKKIKAEEQQDNQNLNSTDPKIRQKALEKKAQSQEALKKIAKEVFIISCASNKTLDESLKFHQKCKLSVRDLSEFGECGLSPLMAVMLSGKGAQDMEKLIGLGANVNEKNAYGFTVLDFARLVDNKMAIETLKEKGAKGLSDERVREEGKQREQNKEEEAKAKAARSKRQQERSQELKELKRAQEQESQLERLRLEQVRIQESMQAIALYREMLGRELQKELETLKEKKSVTAKAEAEIKNNSDKKSVAENHKESATEKEEKKYKSFAKIELENLLQVDLDKVSIDKLLFDLVSRNASPVAVTLLLHNGANINYQEGGRTVLEVAIGNGNNSLVKTLEIFASPQSLEKAVSKAVRSGVNVSSELQKSVNSESNLVEVKKEKEVLKQNSESSKTEKPAEVKEAVEGIKTPEIKLGNENKIEELRKDTADNKVLPKNNSEDLRVEKAVEMKGVETREIKAEKENKTVTSKDGSETKDYLKQNSAVSNEEKLAEVKEVGKEIKSPEIKVGNENKTVRFEEVKKDSVNAEGLPKNNLEDLRVEKAVEMKGVETREIKAGNENNTVTSKDGSETKDYLKQNSAVSNEEKLAEVKEVGKEIKALEIKLGNENKIEEIKRDSADNKVLPKNNSEDLRVEKAVEMKGVETREIKAGNENNTVTSKDGSETKNSLKQNSAVSREEKSSEVKEIVKEVKVPEIKVGNENKIEEVKKDSVSAEDPSKNNSEDLRAKNKDDNKDDKSKSFESASLKQNSEAQKIEGVKREIGKIIEVIKSSEKESEPTKSKKGKEVTERKEGKKPTNSPRPESAKEIGQSRLTTKRNEPKNSNIPVATGR